MSSPLLIAKLWSIVGVALLLLGGCAEKPAKHQPLPPGSSPDAHLLKGGAPTYKNYPVPPQHDTVKPEQATPEQWRALTESAARSAQKKKPAPP